LAQLAASEIAKIIVLKGSLRQAKAVPDVPEKTSLHSLTEHL